MKFSLLEVELYAQCSPNFDILTLRGDNTP